MLASPFRLIHKYERDDGTVNFRLHFELTTVSDFKTLSLYSCDCHANETFIFQKIFNWYRTNSPTAKSDWMNLLFCHPLKIIFQRKYAVCQPFPRPMRRCQWLLRQNESINKNCNEKFATIWVHHATCLNSYKRPLDLHLHHQLHSNISSWSIFKLSNQICSNL